MLWVRHITVPISGIHVVSIQSVIRNVRLKLEESNYYAMYIQPLQLSEKQREKTHHIHFNNHGRRTSPYLFILTLEEVLYN